MATVVDAPPPPPASLEEGQLSLDVSAAPKVPETEAAPAKKGCLATIKSFLKFDFEEFDRQNTAPKLSPLQIFRIFWWIGCRAFGGPVAQIAMMKEELVVEGKWVTQERFNRVYAVYQVLPGPEATELACYFGYLSGGRLGSLAGGFGFITPGVLLMLLWSYLYVEYGLDNVEVQRTFRCLQCAVAALIFRSTYKLAEGALKGPDKKPSWDRGLLTVFCFLTSVIGLNFFIALAAAGIMNFLFEKKFAAREKKDTKSEMLLTLGAYFVGAATLGLYGLYCSQEGKPDGSMIGGESVSGTSLRSLFELGLIAGMVTFGGAYTTLPFIYQAAVLHGGWLTQGQFLDSLAITNVNPTPLVTFICMVGWVGHGIGGALVMTIGIFLPAMSFTLIGHSLFETLVGNDLVHPFLDGVSAAVIGLLLQTAFAFVGTVITSGVDAVVFALAFWAAFHFTDKYTQPMIIVVAAIAGQALYGGLTLENEAST